MIDKDLIERVNKDADDILDPDRSVSGKDQLTYRVTIQRIVDRCFFTIGTKDMSRHVKALKMALFFQIPGLPFKDRILEKEAALKIREKEKIAILKKEHGRYFYGNAEQAKIKLQLSQWYWEAKLEFLLDLLAEHDALMKARDFVETGESV